MCKIKRGKRNMASIYEIANYDTGGSTYVKNDIVAGTGGNSNSVLGRFYYNLGNTPTNAIAPEASGGDAYWGGWTPYGSANTTVPHFFWVPDYGAAVQSEPKVEVIQFGDGYEQRTAQNISANLIKLSLSFQQRDEKEATAIAHFLNTRGAKEAFAFTPPSPYGSIKKFVCRSWDVKMTFQNNYGIDCTFEEVVD
jgi:phage-related protein